MARKSLIFESVVNRLLVMKFGGASLATCEQFDVISDLIIKKKAHYEKIAIVVSAMGKTTDELITLAKKVNPEPPQREYDMLISVGERISMALLAMALKKKGCEATSFTGSQSGIITNDTHTEAKIIDVRPKRLIDHLTENSVVIVAGFQGVSTRGEITTLGRGGSDTTAVALGVALGAEKIEFYKDVPGVYSQDPKKNQSAELFTHISYGKACDLTRDGARILHHRSVELAEKNKMPLHVLSFKEEFLNFTGTIIAGDNEKKPEVPVYELATPPLTTKGM